MKHLFDGYVVRPGEMADACDAAELFNTCSERLTGERPHDANDLRAEWRTPGFDIQRDTRVVLDRNGQHVGYAEVWDVDEPHVRIHGWGRVHPDQCGRGIGTALLAWQEERAGAAIPQAPVEARITFGCGALATDRRTRELLERNGYRAVRSFSRMIIEMESPPAPSVWPEGIRVRSFDPAEDLERTVCAERDSFADHWGHVDTPFEKELPQWRHWIDEDPNFDPDLWFLAEASGEIAGICLGSPTRHEDPELGWIHILGVRRPWRRHGIALALLRHAFGAFYGRGKRKVGLGVDAASLTGAHRLYEKAGMRVNRQSLAFEKVLRDGVDLATRSLGP